MPLKLPRKNVAIKPFDETDFWDDKGIIIKPDTTKSRLTQGIVKQTSPKCEYVKVGDHVIFGAHNGVLIYHEDVGRVIIMSEDVIPCVIESEDIKVSGLYMEEIIPGEAMETQSFTPSISEALELIHAAIVGSNLPNRIKVKEPEIKPITQLKDY